LAIFHFLPTPPTNNWSHKHLKRWKCSVNWTWVLICNYKRNKHSASVGEEWIKLYMAFEDCYYDKRNLQKSAGIKMSKSFPLSGTSLASLESLSLPLVCSFEPFTVFWVLKWAWISILYSVWWCVWLFCWEQVQEVVLSADMQCETCQKRVADIITKMNGKLVSVQCMTICFAHENCFLQISISCPLFALQEEVREDREEKSCGPYCFCCHCIIYKPFLHVFLAAS